MCFVSPGSGSPSFESLKYLSGKKNNRLRSNSNVSVASGQTDRDSLSSSSSSREDCSPPSFTGAADFSNLRADSERGSCDSLYRESGAEPKQLFSMDFNELEEKSLSTPAMQLAVLKKKYELTKTLLRSSLEALPEVKEQLSKSEGISLESLMSFLNSKRREEFLEGVNLRKTLNKESFSFLRRLHQKLEKLEIEIEKLEPDDEGVDVWHDVPDGEARQHYGSPA